MVIALAYIALFDFASFTGSVSFYMLGLIPMQIVTVVLWGANPSFASTLRQPVKGIVLTLVAFVAALVVMPIALQLAGDGVRPPGPIPSHFVVVVVPTTFWLAIMFGGWPFTSLIKHPIASGVAVLVAAYAITYAGFRLFFNYDFMQGAPVYLASAPRGLFNGITSLVFDVTALAVMFLVLCFDLWPLTRSAGVMKQPVLGIVWSVIASGKNDAVDQASGPDTLNSRPWSPTMLVSHRTVPRWPVNILTTDSMAASTEHYFKRRAKNTSRLAAISHVERRESHTRADFGLASLGAAEEAVSGQYAKQAA